MEILPSLGAALAESGRAEESDALLTEAVDQAHATGSERDALRSSVQLLSNRIFRSSEEAEIESASIEVRRAFDLFETSGDAMGMAEAATVVTNLAYVRAHCEEAQRWATRAMFRALAAGLPREATQAAGDLFGMALVGPAPFSRFAADAEELFTVRDPISDCTGHALVAAAALAAGDQAGFRQHEERRRDVVDRHGLTWLAAAHGMEIAFVELWAGRPESAERRLREARQFFASIGNVWYLSVADEYLCEAVHAQDRPREFLRLADAFASSSLMTDRHNLVKRQVTLARAHVLRGSPVEADAAARRALKLLESTDLIHDRVDALLVLSDALDERGMGDEAATARLDAIEKLRAKGNLAAVALLER
jgi:tetratricopeptide (TPR) repeat protein